MGNERRRDYMVNQRVHALYMITWITSLLLVAAAGGTGYSLYKIAPQVNVDRMRANIAPELADYPPAGDAFIDRALERYG